jgi:hypothetical protein
MPAAARVQVEPPLFRSPTSRIEQHTMDDGVAFYLLVLENTWSPSTPPIAGRHLQTFSTIDSERFPTSNSNLDRGTPALICYLV